MAFFKGLWLGTKRSYTALQGVDQEQASRKKTEEKAEDVPGNH
jgi:hypothetical protein